MLTLPNVDSIPGICQIIINQNCLIFKNFCDILNLIQEEINRLAQLKQSVRTLSSENPEIKVEIGLFHLKSHDPKKQIMVP